MCRIPTAVAIQHLPIREQWRLHHLKPVCLQNLLFNNFVCEEYGSGNSSLNGTTAEQTEYEAFVGAVAPTTSIYLEYTPITYVNLPVNLNPFTQFLVRWVSCTLVMNLTVLCLS